MRAAALESFLAHLRLIASCLTSANGDGNQELGLANWPQVVVRASHLSNSQLMRRVCLALRMSLQGIQLPNCPPTLPVRWLHYLTPCVGQQVLGAHFRLAIKACKASAGIVSRL